MESQRPPPSLDDMINGLSDPSIEEPSCEKKEDLRTPTDSDIKAEAVSYYGRNLTDLISYTSTGDAQHHPSTPIKEEPVSCDEGIFTGPEITSHADQIQQHASHPVKMESVSRESGNLTDPNIYTPTDHAPQYSSLIKGESITCDGGNPTDYSIYTPTDHVDHYSSAGMEELSSCDGGNRTNPTDLAHQHASDHGIAEAVLADEERAISTDMYPEAQHSSTGLECVNEDVQSNYSLFDKGNLDTDIYALIKHAQAKYTFTRIEDGSSSEEEENSKDTEPPADHTLPCPTNGPGEAVPQTFQCPDCSECFTRKSGLINHRRNHRQEKLTCSKCGKVFSKRSSLQNHLTLHTGEKPYACPVCGKCFARKSNLISHETIHSGKASFICAECGRYFVCKVHLTKHQIIHEK
ncbi:hypothetical protein GDO78_020773 [Eleutherodactylus coqui]|uniref:C2H2-type domain-containing protein n=2 Tax=Eleutherodactylus coqui TaxID=57060 RepID=A0A8J6ECB9_ELECQ|nr:hypothetical protein GDO78_020773 [Eleutherodactylus coqui]